MRCRGRNGKLFKHRWRERHESDGTGEKSHYRGRAVDRTPMYGWLSANLTDELTRACGSVAAFEDKYEFDAAHIFGGPSTFNKEEIQRHRGAGEEITPETLLDIPFMPVDRMEDYESVRRALAFHKQRGRFCYVQTRAFFEQSTIRSASKTS